MGAAASEPVDPALLRFAALDTPQGLTTCESWEASTFDPAKWNTTWKAVPETAQKLCRSTIGSGVHHMQGINAHGWVVQEAWTLKAREGAKWDCSALLADLGARYSLTWGEFLEMKVASGTRTADGFPFKVEVSCSSDKPDSIALITLRANESFIDGTRTRHSEAWAASKR